MFKDPWGRLHRANDNYDQQEFITNPPESVTFEVLPEDLLTRAAYNMNRSSTREDANRPVTLLTLKQEKEKTKTNW